MPRHHCRHRCPYEEGGEKLIERTFRYTWMLATHKRDELIREGGGEEMEKLPANDIGNTLARAKQAAVDYYRLTGKPLGITGEVGEHEAARLLGLTLMVARAPGYDATDHAGHRYQIKSRAVSDPGSPKGETLGSINTNEEWDAVLMVLMNQEFETGEIWKADRVAVVNALDESDSKASERGVLSVSTFRRIGTRVWPKAR